MGRPARAAALHFLEQHVREQWLRFWARRPCLQCKPGRQSPPLLPLEQNQGMTNALIVNTTYPISD